MKKILFITNVSRRLGIMQRTLTAYQNQGRFLPCQCIWLADDLVWDKVWENKIKSADLIIIRHMGSGLDTSFLQKLLPFIQKANIPHYGDMDGTKAGEYIYGLKSEEINTIAHYFKYGGETNYSNLWLYLEQCLLCHKQLIPPPDPMHWCGIFYPGNNNVYQDLEEYINIYADPLKPYVGIIFYREEWVWQDLEYQTALIHALEKQGLNPICVFTNGLPDEKEGMPSLEEIWNKYFSRNGKPLIDILINTLKFSLSASKSITTEYFGKFGIPIIQAYTIIAPYEEWHDSLLGMNTMEVSISVSLPEFDGVVHGIPIAAKVELPNGDIRYKPIMERIDLLAKKAFNWAKLRHTKNNDKKVAIIFHNYPPKNSNIGSAFSLDSIASVIDLLVEMKKKGYTIDFIPESSKDFIELLTANATNDVELLTDKQIENSPKLFKSDYLSFFNKLPIDTQKAMEESWGEPPGDLLNFDNDLLIPGTMNGNVFITMQPARGFGEDPSKILHDPASPPPHQYLGFYFWLSNIWQADVVVHVGTHGSQEWLPGKNAGLDAKCYPSITMEALPNIYPYLISITGEGIQAKRRGFATLIEYLPAPQTTAGLYGELEEIEKLAEEYFHFQQEDGMELQELEKILLEKITKTNLELSYNPDEKFIDYLGRLHNYLTELKHMTVQTGLHILGEAPKEQQLIEYIELLLKVPNNDIDSLPEVLAELQGYDFYELKKHSAELLVNKKTKGQMAEDIVKQSISYVETLAKKGYMYMSADDMLRNLPNFNLVNEDMALLNKLNNITDFVIKELYPNILATKQEIDFTIKGLAGEYIPPGPSGAPSSGGAALLPTGRNFYGVDPRILPTPGAWALGVTMGDQLIREYINNEGRYPENIGIVLWSGAAMRTHGQSVAEMLYLMGVKPSWLPGTGRIKGLEVIPLEELKRPRIDTTARISGLFRDTLPNLSELLDSAVELVAKLNEDDEENFIRKHVLTDMAELEKSGFEPKDAWRQATYRIFGDELGAYGAGISNILDSQQWDNMEDLSEVYIRWGCHAYGKNASAVSTPNMFRKRMASIDVTVQNTDNREVNMISCDDYNDYHGGMIATVTALKGKAPLSFHGDFSNRKATTMRTVKEEATMIFRSENINPKFIEGMMKHDYKGAADMVKRMNYTYQWDATSRIVEDWMYEAYADKYILDAKVQEWLKDVNPWALQHMIEILLEANQRDLWDTSEQRLEELRQLYLEIDGDIEGKSE